MLSTPPTLPHNHKESEVLVTAAERWSNDKVAPSEVINRNMETRLKNQLKLISELKMLLIRDNHRVGT